MLKWARDLEWNTEAFLAFSGSVVIGNVRSIMGGSRWRWEIVSLPGMFSRVDERFDWVDTEAEAKSKVQALFDQWLGEAQLVSTAPASMTTIGIFGGDPDTVTQITENSTFDEMVQIVSGRLLLSREEVERLFGIIAPETGLPICTKEEWDSAPSDDRETFFYSFCNLYDSLGKGQ